MPYLKDLKKQIDAGRTAKHQQFRSILHHRVRKELGFYARQAEGYKNELEVVVVPAATSFYPNWEMLLDSFQGRYEDDEWVVCDEKFEDYLPPEREDIPDCIVE
jgi:hypothetical protein